jgi:type VI secretion system secreted protein Hcp
MPTDMFVKIGDVAGESTDGTHKDSIEVLSWSWGVSNPVSSTGTTGLSAGKDSLSEISFMQMMDKSTPALQLACATGKHYPTATLTARKSGGGQVDYLIVKMFEVFVSSLQVSQGEGSVPAINVSLAYNKMELEYKIQKADGTVSPGGTFKYSVAENKTY